MGQPTKVKQFIATNCASYDRDGLCHMETDSSGGRLCPLMYSLSKKCTYAETSVIPESAEIEALYYAGSKPANVNLINCAECSSQFERTSNRQKRCSECARNKHNQRQRESRLKASIER